MTRIPDYALYLFDADGTLLDFEAGEREALCLTFQRFGLPEAEMDRYRQINSALWRQLAEGAISRDRLFASRFGLFAEALGIRLDAAQANRYFLEQLSHQAQLIPGAAETLEILSRRAQIAIVTNGVGFAQRERFRRSGLMPHISQLVISEEVGAEKPSPLIFERALALCGHPDKASVLMVGDDPLTDIAGAVAFGIDACLFDPNGVHKENFARFRITSLNALTAE